MVVAVDEDAAGTVAGVVQATTRIVWK